MTLNPGKDLDLEAGEVFLVDKPADWTSFDVVNKMRRIFRIKRIGHAGTLDKSATGLLIVCTGRKTKELSSFQQLEKEYDVTMRLGEKTESYDTETPVIHRHDLSGMDEEAIRSTIAAFVGIQKQLPPMWSAVKVAGTPLYRYARKGIEVPRKERDVFIERIDVRTIALPDVTMTVVCSKGTYIRSLVNDIGEALGVGAHVVRLRRTRIGNYHVADALTIEDLLHLNPGRPH
ncbi:MAG: tRNA pseudouridine(55) synthase TruB [Ignavibacteria bacterium]